METFISVLISGLAVGLVYGVVGFAKVFLFKMTGVINIAIPNMGMFSAFIAYKYYAAGGLAWPLALILAAVTALAFGALAYALIILPREDVSRLNLFVRTLGLFLLLYALADYFWRDGQPFITPKVFPDGALMLGSVRVSYADACTAAVCLVLGGVAAIVLRRTRFGLEFLALADNYFAARLVGLQVRWLTMAAWAATAVVALIAAIIVAQMNLLSSHLMDHLLLFAFAGAVLGGLTSLTGAFVGGAMTGVITSMVTYYVGADMAVVAAFLLLIATLIWKPEGLFGQPQIHRL